MRRHRRCGCDCRDDDCEGPFTTDCDDETIVSRSLCSECPQESRPCTYIARFGCNVRDADGNPIARDNEILKQQCEFENRCDWVSLGFALGDYTHGSNWFSHYLDKQICVVSPPVCLARYYWSAGCTWNDISFQYCSSPCGNVCNDLIEPPDLIAATGTNWTLTLADGGATFTSSHGSYSVDQWECEGKNTLKKVDGDDNLPASVCISPWYDQEGVVAFDEHGVDDGCLTDTIGDSVSDDLIRELIWGCDTSPKKWVLTDGVTQELCACNIPCEYDTEQERIDCCDACCECFSVSVNGDCSGTPITSSGEACTGGRTGLSSPAGVSREYCFNVNDGYGSHEICLVFYCNGEAWKLDAYCDGVFDSEGVVEDHTCCPLKFRFSFTVAS